MLLAFKIKTFIIAIIVTIVVIGGAFAYMKFRPPVMHEICKEQELVVEEVPSPEPTQEEKDYIRWAQFDVNYDLLVKAYNFDVKSIGQEVRLDWIELLAYAVSRNYGNVGNSTDDRKVAGYMDEGVKMLREGKTIEEITENLQYYDFYYEVYDSVLGGFLQDGELQVFSPVAKGRWFNHYEDFGNARSYGYRRKHLGNDLMGAVGTPNVFML